MDYSLQLYKGSRIINFGQSAFFRLWLYSKYNVINSKSHLLTNNLIGAITPLYMTNPTAELGQLKLKSNQLQLL